MSTNFVGPDILLRLLLPMVEKSDIRVVLHTTSLSAFRKFELKQINEIHTYGRIKSYATSKLLQQHRCITMYQSIQEFVLNSWILVLSIVISFIFSFQNS